MSTADIELTDKFLASFQMFPNFRRPVHNDEKRICAIKFSADGERLVAASNQRTIEVYDCNTGRQEHFFFLHKYGMSAISFMETKDVILVGSAVKGDYSVRELNMATNQFATRYFGHQRPSVSLAVNFQQQLFVSGGFDKSALIFDFRCPHASLSLVDLPAAPLVALHPSTDNLCVLGLEDSRIELHDLRNWKKPFNVFKLNADPAKWNSMKFSPDGDQILISSNSSKIRVVNSFHGTAQAIFDSRRNTLNIPIDASFTPNSEYILSGSTNGNVLVFANNKKNQRKSWEPSAINELKSRQSEAITAVEMNRKYTLMVTASSYVAFWAPPTED